jgi:glycolate oxidase iron-sulfur subunit
VEERVGVGSRFDLLDYEATLDCVHCGLCLPHCPTYQETGRESSSPRGRIYLMRGVAEGRLPIDDERVVEEAYFCLACRACESACPAGVRYGHLVESLRAEIDAHGARSRLARALERLALRGVIGRPASLRAGFALLRIYQRTGLQTLARRTGLVGLLGPLADAERLLPRVPPREELPVLVPARGPRRGRVALFTGCVMRELFSATNAATARVLAENGFEVEVPRGQRCCGALHLHSGDPAAAARLRRANRSAFHLERLDAVILNSAGCGASLREAGDELAHRVRDVSEFLHEAGLRAPTHELRLRVAYDDPCHLLHGQKVREAPRALLRSIPGLELFDLPGAADCCGAAGIYNLTHPETSRRLLERKVGALRDTRPDVVATGNPGCLLQLGRGIREAGLPVEVLHPVDLLDRAYHGAGA